MENGEWSMENEEWRMENGEWRMENGAWSVERGGWSVENGARRVERGAWRIENEMEIGNGNEKLEMENSFFGKEFNDYYVVEKFISGDYRYPRFLSKGFRGKFNIRE